MTTVFELTKASVLRVSGKHAERYLQARLSNDVRLATEKKAIMAAALSPQGKVEAYFAVFRRGPADFLLLVDGGDVTEVTEALLRFRVTEQVEVSVESHLKVMHLDASQEFLGLMTEAKAGDVCAMEFGFTIGQRRLETLGTDVLLSVDAQGKFSTWSRNFAITAGTESEFQERRLRAKQCMYPFELNSHVILLEAGLEQAVSFTKGCYAGQEVIARIDSQGRTPRLLRFFSARQDACPTVGAQIYRADDVDCQRAVGTVMYVAQQKESGYICSAYVKNDPEILKNSLRLASGELQGLE